LALRLLLRPFVIDEALSDALGVSPGETPLAKATDAWGRCSGVHQFMFAPPASWDAATSTLRVSAFLRSDLVAGLEGGRAFETYAAFGSEPGDREPPPAWPELPTEVVIDAEPFALDTQPERLLALIPPAEAQADGDLMRLRLIALSVRGNWAQIERELANPGVMDPLLVDVFRAVTARERNQPVLAAEHWRRAAEKTQASLDERRRFAAIALQLRAYDQALPAVQALLRSPLDRLRALRQLVQIYEATGNLEGVRSVMRDWAKDAPDDPTPRTAFVYLCGLMRRDIPEAEAQGRELVERYPDRAAVRAALALVLLRRDNPVDALEQFARIRPELDLALPGWRAVYAAVLDANGQPEQARAILRPVKPEMLRPEERQLVEKLLSTGG
ncbi:MAG TPA: hypothetical protein PKE47_09220, partial [Verrucomicrobiota bacterium]|nr:hypothetical protein [Verrucomicrobiota bacterium]